MPRPVDMYGGAVHWAFPSSHATMALVIYGFLALLCSRDVKPGLRWLPFALSLFLVLTIGFSRLYLGAHWLADVVGGFSLGTAWLIVMTVVYLHGGRRTSCRGLFRFTLPAFLVLVIFHWATGFHDNWIRYRPHHTVIRMTTKQWIQSGWRHLPLYRFDLGGEKEQPLNLQYAGTLADLEKALQRSGWHRPIPLRPATSLHWLMPESGWNSLPVLPQFHDGRNEVLLLVNRLPVSKSERLVTIVQQDTAPQVRAAAIQRLIELDPNRFLESAESFTNLVGEVTVKGRSLSLGSLVESEKDTVRRTLRTNDDACSTPSPK